MTPTTLTWVALQGALREKTGAPFPPTCPRERRCRLWVRSQPAWFQIASLRSPWQTVNLCLPQFPHLGSEDNIGSDLRGLLRGAPGPRCWHCGKRVLFPSGKQQTTHLDAQEEEVTCQMGLAGTCQSWDSNPGPQAPRLSPDSYWSLRGSYSGSKRSSNLGGEGIAAFETGQSCRCSRLVP